VSSNEGFLAERLKHKSEKLIEQFRRLLFMIGNDSRSKQVKLLLGAFTAEQYNSLFAVQ